MNSPQITKWSIDKSMIKVEKKCVVCSCCWWRSILTSWDALIPDCPPKILSSQGQRKIWLWSRPDRHVLMRSGGAWTHNSPPSRFTGAQASASSYHGFAKGRRCQQRMQPSPRLPCSSHFRFSSFRSHFFFRRAFSAAVPAFRLLWRIFELAFVIVDFS